MANQDITENRRHYRLITHEPTAGSPEFQVSVSERTGTSEMIYTQVFERTIRPDETRDQLIEEAKATIKEHAKKPVSS